MRYLGIFIITVSLFLVTRTPAISYENCNEYSNRKDMAAFNACNLRNSAENDTEILSNPFAVGDIVERYRTFDYGEGRWRFLNGKDSEINTQWCVVAITDDGITMRLTSGRYRWDYDNELFKEVGYQNEFKSSIFYNSYFPGRLKTDQIFKEWRLVHRKANSQPVVGNKSNSYSQPVVGNKPNSHSGLLLQIYVITLLILLVAMMIKEKTFDTDCFWQLLADGDPFAKLYLLFATIGAIFIFLYVYLESR